MNTQEEKGLGAVLNPEDNRDIALASFVRVPVKANKKNITDISMLPVEDQEKLGTCVGQAEGKGQEWREYLEGKKVTKLSKRFIYRRCKDQDGLAAEGTYPRIAAKVLTDDGTPTCELVPEANSLPHDQYLAFPISVEILEDASTKRVKGYAFCYTLDEVKAAIDLEGVMNATLFVGDWSALPVKPQLANGSNRGTHRVLLYGYEDAKNGKANDTKIYFRNSWGINWAKGKTTADRKLLKEGNGYFWWSEYQAWVRDLMVYTDMPNEVKKQAQETKFVFTREMDHGDRGSDITELQKRLYKEKAKDGLPCFRYPNATNPTFTAYFGDATQEAVQRYQAKEGLASSGTPTTTGYGRVGPKTLARLNGGSTPAKVDLYPVVEHFRDQLVAIMAAFGKEVIVTDAYRSIEEQDALYAIGRTKPGTIVTNAKGGDSFHNWRCAFDVAFVKNGKPSWDESHPWEVLGTVGKVLGLEWGGDWTGLVDRPHFQYTAGYTLADFKAGRVDERMFGVISTEAEGEEPRDAFITQEAMKRFKSGLVVFASIMLTAFVAVLPTAEWTTFTEWLRDLAVGAGIPVAVWGLLAAVVSQAWFAFLNYRNAQRAGYGDDVVTAARDGAIDTY